MTDLVIICKDGEVKADRAKMAAASPVFNSMLNGPFIEGSSETINMHDDSVEIIQAAVTYIQHKILPRYVTGDLLIFFDRYDVYIPIGQKIRINIDEALLLYGKIENTPILLDMQKAIPHIIDRTVRSRYLVECSACGEVRTFVCKICIQNYYKDTCYDCKQILNKQYRSHDMCLKDNGKWVPRKNKFNNPDYDLIGRAMMKLYGNQTI